MARKATTMVTSTSAYSSGGQPVRWPSTTTKPPITAMAAIRSARKNSFFDVDPLHHRCGGTGIVARALRL